MYLTGGCLTKLLPITDPKAVFVSLIAELHKEVNSSLRLIVYIRRARSDSGS